MSGADDATARPDRRCRASPPAQSAYAAYGAYLAYAENGHAHAIATQEANGLVQSNGQLTFVYLREHHGQEEYWFPSDLFEEVAGDSRKALALKKELFGRGLLETTRRGGAGVSYVVKRPLPDGTRPFFVVIRHQAKKPQSLSPALPTAAPA